MLVSLLRIHGDVWRLKDPLSPLPISLSADDDRPSNLHLSNARLFNVPPNKPSEPSDQYLLHASEEHRLLGTRAELDGRDCILFLDTSTNPPKILVEKVSALIGKLSEEGAEKVVKKLKMDETEKKGEVSLVSAIPPPAPSKPVVLPKIKLTFSKATGLAVPSASAPLATSTMANQPTIPTPSLAPAPASSSIKPPAPAKPYPEPIEFSEASSEDEEGDNTPLANLIRNKSPQPSSTTALAASTDLASPPRTGTGMGAGKRLPLPPEPESTQPQPNDDLRSMIALKSMKVSDSESSELDSDLEIDDLDLDAMVSNIEDELSQANDSDDNGDYSDVNSAYSESVGTRTPAKLPPQLSKSGLSRSHSSLFPDEEDLDASSPDRLGGNSNTNSNTNSNGAELRDSGGVMPMDMGGGKGKSVMPMTLGGDEDSEEEDD